MKLKLKQKILSPFYFIIAMFSTAFLIVAIVPLLFIMSVMCGEDEQYTQYVELEDEELSKKINRKEYKRGKK